MKDSLDFIFKKMKSIKQLEKEYEKESKKCVENAYDPKKDDWNKKHFNRCDGDVIAGKLDQTEEIVKMIESEKNKFAETEITEYSEGYSSGWIKACEGILTKIKGEEK